MPDPDSLDGLLRIGPFSNTGTVQTKRARSKNMQADSYSPEEIDKILSEPIEPDEIKIFTTSEEKTIALKMLPMLAEKANKMAEATKARELEKAVIDLKAWNEKQMADKLEEITKRNTPPTVEEMEKLVSQDYVEFRVKLRKDGEMKEFVISELPQSVETKFFKRIKSKLAPHIQKFTQLEWTTGSTLDRLQNLIEVVPEVMDTLADAAAISLDPRGEHGITTVWVQENLSSSRIMNIVECQIQAGRFRDFFLAVARVIPS